MSDCPSPTLTAQLDSGQLMHSTYWTGFYGRSATPRYRRRPLGDLIVPTGWRRWGGSMDFPSFFRILLKGLKGDSASSCSQGPTWSSSLGIPDEGTLNLILFPMDPRWGNPKRAAEFCNSSKLLIFSRANLILFPKAPTKRAAEFLLKGQLDPLP